VPLTYACVQAYRNEQEALPFSERDAVVRTPSRMGSFVQLSSFSTTSSTPPSLSATAQTTSATPSASGGLFAPELSHAFDAVPALPFMIRPAAETASSAPVPQQGVRATPATVPTAITSNIRTLRRIRHMRAALRAKVHICADMCVRCACLTQDDLTRMTTTQEEQGPVAAAAAVAFTMPDDANSDVAAPTDLAQGLGLLAYHAGFEGSSSSSSPARRSVVAAVGTR
jgi:hypothetical protein